MNKLNKIQLDLQQWSNSHIFKMLIFNTVLVFLVLMRSAGYFLPFFGISINFIVIFMLILSIFLLGANSRSMFLIALLFWLFAAFMKVLKVDIWAERTAIYTYESLAVGLVLILFENFRKNEKD